MQRPVLSLGIALAAAACASAPETAPERRSLEAAADATVARMAERDPSLVAMLEAAPGHVVFPRIGKGGFVFGGTSGAGVLYESGAPTGYVELRGGSVGAQIGGQSYSELVVFHDPAPLEALKGGDFRFRADATATAVTAGAAATDPGDRRVSVS